MSLLRRHLAGENMGRFPVWMMRQAGRYLPSYRRIREKHAFWEMVTTPEIAAEVSCLPLEELRVDATIFFSDILTLPYGLGVRVELREKVGPVLEKPLRCESDFLIFTEYDPYRHTGFVPTTLSLIRQRLPAENCLIGFAGAPWTVGCYLVEGKTGRNFEKIKGWAYTDPLSLSRSLEMLSQASYRYLESQVLAGAQVLQLFDTWLSTIPNPFFNDLYLPALTSLCSRLIKLQVPIVYFAKGVAKMPLLRRLGVTVLGVDSSVSLGEAEKIMQCSCSLQGNLDPVLLLGNEAEVRRHTRELVLEARGLKHPPILNLGHGILPETPLKNARAFVEEARTLWV